MRKNLVIFDVDGLVLNTEFQWQRAWKTIGKQYNCPEFENVFAKVVGVSGKAVDEVVGKALPTYTKEQRETMCKEARELGREYLEQGIETMPGLTELLDYLDKIGLCKAVATTTCRADTKKRLEKLGLYNRFDYILCGDEVVNRKPDPEIYLKVLQGMQRRPEEALVLEDTGHGVRSAHAAGIDVIMVPSINPPTPEEQTMVYDVKNNLYEVMEMIKNIGTVSKGNNKGK
ncbi:MAG: HAD family phosphatase [Herbinix sp.]|nr:HAD family phosphatase [Herbinix sp.]